LAVTHDRQVQSKAQDAKPKLSPEEHPARSSQSPRNRRARIKAEQQATKEDKEETTNAAAFDISVFESQAPAMAFDSSTYAAKREVVEELENTFDSGLSTASGSGLSIG
jgi:hypothetical protein